MTAGHKLALFAHPTQPPGGFGRALLVAATLLCTGPAQAQFSAAGSAAAESAVESAGRRDAVASYGRHNIYRAGRTVRVVVPIEGDFLAAGSRVVLDAPVKGDSSLVAGGLEVRMPVSGDLRALAGKHTIGAGIGGDLMLAGSEITLERESRIAGDALIAGRSVDVRGEIDGELTVYAQQVVIGGIVKGKVRLVAEEIELLDGARIDGALSYTSPNEIKRAPGVAIEGQVVRTEGDKAQDNAAGARTRSGHRLINWGLLGSVLWSLGLFAFGVMMLSVFPAFTRSAAQRVSSQALAALGLGFALVVCLPVAAGIAILTIIGIPIGASVLALYPVLLLAGYLTGIWSVAIRVRALLGGAGAGSSPVLAGWLAVSLAVLLLVGVVPFLGWIISAWITLAGVGAMALTLWNRRGLTA